MIVSFVLLICMIYDLRSRHVPGWLTLTILFGSGIYAIYQGRWISVLVTIALILVSDIPNTIWRRSLAGFNTAIAACLAPASAGALLAIFFVWLLWDKDWLGGADVKLIASVLLVFNTPLVMIPIFLVGGIQGLIASIRKEKFIPYVLSIFLGTVIFVALPQFHG